jgi:hypothetical protein
VPVEAGFQCAGCGEWNDITVDDGGGPAQQYVQDCQVCCKPNLLKITFDREIEEYVVTAALES